MGVWERSIFHYLCSPGLDALVGPHPNRSLSGRVSNRDLSTDKCHMSTEQGRMSTEQGRMSTEQARMFTEQGSMFTEQMPRVA